MRTFSFAGAVLVIIALVACGSSPSTPTYQCRNSDIQCACSKVMDPTTIGGPLLTSCPAVANDCCAVIHYASDPDYCHCNHDPTNPGYGYKSCAEFLAGTSMGLSYVAVTRCPQ
jgi:hypothetical protein